MVSGVAALPTRGRRDSQCALAITIARGRGSHADKRSDIPEKREARRDAWQEAFFGRRPAPVQQQKVEQNPERNRARAVANRVDQNRGVKTEPVRHLNNYNSAW